MSNLHSQGCRILNQAPSYPSIKTHTCQVKNSTLKRFSFGTGGFCSADLTVSFTSYCEREGDKSAGTQEHPVTTYISKCVK